MIFEAQMIIPERGTNDLGQVAKASSTFMQYAVCPRYRQVNRVAQLIDDVRLIHVDRDERRQLLTLYATGKDGTSYPARGLAHTWRDRPGSLAISKGRLLAYLNPVSRHEDAWSASGSNHAAGRPRRRVIDREDVRQYKLPLETAE